MSTNFLKRMNQISRTGLLLFISITLLSAYFLFPSSHKTPSFPTFPKDEYVYPLAQHVQEQQRPKRVGIVGAGASGSAAAFFLRRAGKVVKDRIGKEVLGEIVVFEKEDYVGGRSTTVFPHSDPRYRPIELGASIFVEANRHLVKAAKKFNLTTIDPDFGEAGVGIWDGTQFLYTTSTKQSYFSSWLDTISAIRRYGFSSPYRTDKSVKVLLKKFANLYNPLWLAEKGAPSSIEDFAERAGLGKEYTTRWGEEYALKVVGVGEKWESEIWEGSTRVNYASDMSDIHALGASVSMATGGAMAVQGGNWRIFQSMSEDSKATVHLGTQVVDIIPLQDGRFDIVTNTTDIVSASSESFDQIFFAAPWHSSPINKDLQSQFHEPIPTQKYVHLHVTLIGTTRRHASPEFFGLPSTTTIPSTILTTGHTSRNDNTPPPLFQSITWHGETAPGSGEYVVKIFSLTYLKESILSELLGEEPTWVLRKEWDSYPKLKVTATYAPVEPMRGLQYLAALEPWVSTMETQTISARDAVARVVEDWWGLGMGECRGGVDSWDWSCDP
ncbi:hypothetical protein M231_03632 [Tremella mesenterica]|uniref:Prenylcysteine lyase domain-containing protein n=1 Tax=Tremella mesenterica TaxID=5217 RepID=A0A4V1M449_TREME|nr:uncharacterized protein TREMEDRAFT_73026 [Tremella mesenterica DSM 1558]EIW73268.1 hypothetical protein TREMEDRAFT_73026 [Tremella mesenterica DSM 1558]RXK39127.1 hypothetical protein M231_03632 [Tremella mesenterica]